MSTRGSALAHELPIALTAHALVRTYMHDPDRRLWPWIDVAQLERLVASIGSGVDPLEGEEPIAVLLHTGTARGGCLTSLELVANVLNPIRWMVRSAMKNIDWNHGALLTDQRLVVRDWLEAVDAPYSSVVDPTCTGGIGSFFGFDFLNFTVGDKRFKLAVPGHTALRRFLEVASEEARNQRMLVERIPAPHPEPGDPSGAVAFLGMLRVDDPRAAVLLELIAKSVAEGSIEAEPGLDLARRTALFHRATVSARGSRDGMWISCLRRDELVTFLESRLGRPEPVESEDGLETIVFHRDREYARAVLGTALVLASGTLDGVLPKGDLRFAIEERTHPEAGTYTAYRAEVKVPLMWQPMSEFESKSLYELHLQLLAFEAQVLLRRVVFGPEVPTAELLEADPVQVDALLAAEVERALPKWFRTPRDFANIHKRVANRPASYGLTRDRLPAHLPPPVSTAVPAEVLGIGMVNLTAGLVTLSVLSTVYCFGGVTVVSWLQSSVFTQVPGLDEDATAGVLTLLLLFQWGLLCLAGPVRALGGLLVLLVPRAAFGIGILMILQGLLGLVILDIPGFLAAVVTAWWLTRKHVREYLG